MKKYFQLLGMLLFLIGLSACAESEDKTGSTNKDGSSGLSSPSPHLNQEKGTPIDKAELEKKSRYQVDLYSGDQTYNLYFFANDETSWIEKESSLQADAGDMMHEGTYQVALGIKGAKTYYVNEQLNLMDGQKMIWNSTHPYVEKIGDSMLAIYQHETVNTKIATLLTVEEGRILDLTADSGLLLTGSIKQIDENTIQTSLYSNSEPSFGWSFSTYERKKEALEKIDQVNYYGDLVEHGLEVQERWAEDADYFISYRDLSVYSPWLDEAAEGRLVGVPFPLGTDIKTIRKDKPNVVIEAYYNALPYLDYLTETYFYNETTEKSTGLGIPGTRVGGTLDEFKEKVGVPDEEGLDLENDLWVLNYQTGENNLNVYGDPETGQLESIFLFAPNEYNINE